MSHISKTVAKIIHQLYNDGDLDKGTLAKLRTANSLLSRDATAIWPLLFGNIEDKQDLSQTGEPSFAETAIFASLRAYAIYQQGTEESVFKHSDDWRENRSLFQAFGRLRSDPDFTDSLDKRVSNVLTSLNFQSTENSITQLVRILKSKGQGGQIDFAQLGEDLYRFQFSSESARQVTLKWGQDYYWNNLKDNQE